MKHRIYINAPVKHIVTILKVFVSQCEEKKLPFELKYDSVASSNRNDTIIIGSNTYFKNSNQSQLSPESRIEIIKAIIRKEVCARETEYLISSDLDILCKAEPISEELWDKSSTLCTDARGNYLVDDFILSCEHAFLDRFSSKRPLASELNTSSNSLSPEQIKQKIDERRLDIIEYFSTPIESAEKKQPRIELLRTIIMQFLKDMTFPDEIMSILKSELSLLENDIKQVPEKISIGSQVCSELASENIDCINIDAVLKHIKPIQQ